MIKTQLGRTRWVGLLVVPMLTVAACSSGTPAAGPAAASPSTSAAASASAQQTASAPQNGATSPGVPTASPSAPAESGGTASETTSDPSCPPEPSRAPRSVRSPSGDLSTQLPGGIALIGPTLIAKGIDRQVLIADVTNQGDVTAKWRVELDLPVGSADDITLAVPAMQTARVEIPIEVTRAASTEATVSLNDADGVVSRSTLSITSVDLSDCGQ